MVKNPIEWLRSKFDHESPLSTKKPIKMEDDNAFYLTGGSGIRMWPSGDPRRPINANVTIAIKMLRSNLSISPVTVPVHIPTIVAAKIMDRIHSMGQVDPYFSGFGVQHVSIHAALHISKVPTDNSKLYLLNVNGASIIPNLWFVKQESYQEDDLLIQSSTGALTLQQVVAANRTLVYRGKRIDNIPLRINRGKVLFLGEKYDFSNFEDEILSKLQHHELMSPRGGIAIRKMDETNELVYRRALHFLAKEISEYNGVPFEEPVPGIKRVEIYEAE